MELLRRSRDAKGHHGRGQKRSSSSSSPFRAASAGSLAAAKIVAVAVVLHLCIVYDGLVTVEARDRDLSVEFDPEPLLKVHEGASLKRMNRVLGMVPGNCGLRKRVLGDVQTFYIAASQDLNAPLPKTLLDMKENPIYEGPWSFALLPFFWLDETLNTALFKMRRSPPCTETAAEEVIEAAHLDGLVGALSGWAPSHGDFVIRLTERIIRSSFKTALGIPCDLADVPVAKPGDTKNSCPEDHPLWKNYFARFQMCESEKKIACVAFSTFTYEELYPSIGYMLIHSEPNQSEENDGVVAEQRDKWMSRKRPAVPLKVARWGPGGGGDAVVALDRKLWRSLRKQTWKNLNSLQKKKREEKQTNE